VFCRESARNRKRLRKLLHILEGGEYVLLCCRADYSKAIVEAVQAFVRVLRALRQKGVARKICLLLVAAPTRNGDGVFGDYWVEILEAVKSANNEFNGLAVAWIQQDGGLSRQILARAMRAPECKGVLVPSHKDGLVLNAFEGVCAADPEDPAPVAISTGAGASYYLTKAPELNPKNPRQMAEVIERMIDMPLEMRKSMHQAHLEVAIQQDIDTWAPHLIEEAASVAEELERARAYIAA